LNDIDDARHPHAEMPAHIRTVRSMIPAGFELL